MNRRKFILISLPSKKTAAAAVRKFCCGAALGALVFVAIYGFATLDPTYDSWIRCGYVEQDVLQHYAAWQYLRNASWQFPLTWLDNLAAPTGAAAAWGDPLPWAALFFKLLSPILPATFQYIGIVSLLHYMLQGGFAWLLADLFDSRIGVCIPSALLFCAWPVLIERTFRHTSLSAQWVILWMLYLYFTARRQKRLPWFSWCILFGLIPGIHAYYLPMAFGLLCASALEYLLRTRKLLPPVLLAGGCIGLTLCCARALGVIMPNIITAGDGYGVYSMNLNAPFNPSSMDLYTVSGKLDWSLLLPQLSQIQRQYDGFNYLGLGVLLGLAAALVYGIILLIRCGLRAALIRLLHSLWDHIGLVIASAVFTVFAASHIMYWGETLLCRIPLPESIWAFLGTFRASGRIFWPVGYTLALGVIVFIARVLPKEGRGRHLAVLALCLLLAVQLADLGGVLSYKAAHFRTGGQLVPTGEFETQKAEQLISSADEVRCLGRLMYYDLAESLIRYNPDIRTDIAFFTHGNYGMVLLRYEDSLAQLQSGAPIAEDVLYIACDRETCDAVLAAAHEDVVAWQIENFYFFGVAAEGRPAPDYT